MSWSSKHCFSIYFNLFISNLCISQCFFLSSNEFNIFIHLCIKIFDFFLLTCFLSQWCKLCRLFDKWHSVEIIPPKGLFFDSENNWWKLSLIIIYIKKIKRRNNEFMFKVSRYEHVCWFHLHWNLRPRSWWNINLLLS